MKPTKVEHKKIFKLTLYLILSLLIDDHDRPNPGNLPSTKLLPCEAVINEAAYTDAGITEAAYTEAVINEAAEANANSDETTTAEAASDTKTIAEGAFPEAVAADLLKAPLAAVVTEAPNAEAVAI